MLNKEQIESIYIKQKEELINLISKKKRAKSYDVEKEKLEKSIKSINEKYSVKKRWRAENEGYYYYMHSDYSLIGFAIDHCFTEDNNRYEAGNYFNTEKEAKEYKEYMKKCSLEWHEIRGRK